MDCRFVILALAATFFKMSIWPLVVKWFETSEKRADTAECFLKEQIKLGQEQVLRSEARNQKICDDFAGQNKKICEDFVASLDRIAEGQKNLVEEFRRLENAVQRSK